MPLPRVSGTELTLPIRTSRAYAWPETPATGLRKFNLGTIPASVTPPRTWRRAAWFAVGAATFVVVALGYAAVTLVGNPRTGSTIDALPGQPSQQLLITGLPADETTTSAAPATSSPTTTSTSSSSAARTTTTTPPRQRDTNHRASPHIPEQGRPAPTAASPVRPPRPGTSQKPGAPPRSTVEAAALSATDADKMGDLTEAYYANVLRDPAAACALTTGRMRAEGPEGIEARYADIERIEVKQIMIDPNWSFTRSVLVYKRKDGSTVTVRRELTFSQGANPRITSDTETW